MDSFYVNLLRTNFFFFVYDGENCVQKITGRIENWKKITQINW